MAHIIFVHSERTFSCRWCLTIFGCIGCSIGIILAVLIAFGLFGQLQNIWLMLLLTLLPIVCLAIPCCYVCKVGVNACMIGKPHQSPPPSCVSSVPLSDNSSCQPYPYFNFYSPTKSYPTQTLPSYRIRGSLPFYPHLAPLASMDDLRLLDGFSPKVPIRTEKTDIS